jgi:tRNA A37 threonylcarbamoyladenosine biosynthesis protein TsaE
LEEVIGTDGVAYVEWPSRLPELFPRDLLHVYLETVGDGRRATLIASGPVSEAWLARSFKDERP